MAMIALRMTMVLAAMVMAVMVTRAAMVAMTMLSVMVRMLTDPKKLVDVFDPLTLGNKGPQREGVDGWWEGWLRLERRLPPLRGPHPLRYSKANVLPGPPKSRVRREG